MKNLSIFATVLLCGTVVLAAEPAPVLNWSLLWSGSWEEKTFTFQDEPSLSGTLGNRGETKLQFLQPNLTLRAQVLDRHPLDFSLEPPWGEPDKGVTNYTGGLYHKPTGSRLLYGTLDEWGLPARIRNPWIRSPAYAENHKPIIADLKTAASSTKEDEAYLYLSSPLFKLFPDVNLRTFISAQSEVDEFTPAFSGGLDFTFKKTNNLLLETFYTGKTLSPSKPSAWFSDKPPLPQREFRLFAAGLLFTNPDFSVSSDFALSETFAVGKDIYANLGISYSPSLPFGQKSRPLLISLSADGAGERFVYRDGVNHGGGFRGAAKIEWNGKYGSLIRLNTVLRGPGFGEDFNRSSSGFYWRFPSSAAIRNNTLRLTRISLSMDRNAANPLKISDSFTGNLGISLNMRKIGIKNPLGVNFSGSIKGLAGANVDISPFPVLDKDWSWETADVNCELLWSAGIFQFRTKGGCVFFPEKDEKWDFSLNTTIHFKQGRFSFKVSSPDFPEKWNWTASWRMELQRKW
ncbi:hypothetical protein R84B8_00367 [Treponema sp. R8-4-B8]